MRNRLALLGFLMLVSVGMVYAANASGTLRVLAGRAEVKIDVDEVLMFTKMSPEERGRAVEIALADPWIQGMLEGVEEYRTSVSEILDVQEIEGGIALVPKEGLALVELRIHKDYRGEELGLKVVKVTVDLLKGEVKEVEEFPEVRKPKVHEGIISTDELLRNPSKYHEQVVTVSGKVSNLGEVRGPYFMLDEKVWVCYLHEETSVDISNVTNGDYVIVTGKFWAEDTIYAQKIENATGHIDLTGDDEIAVESAEENDQPENTAIHIGKHFLDGIGYVTGDVLFVKLDEETPNFYWHELAKLEKPHVQELRPCWIVRFEQAHRPGHWFEVWIDAQTGEVIGGMQCR